MSYANVGAFQSDANTKIELIQIRTLSNKKKTWSPTTMNLVCWKANFESGATVCTICLKGDMIATASTTKSTARCSKSTTTTTRCTESSTAATIATESTTAATESTTTTTRGSKSTTTSTTASTITTEAATSSTTTTTAATRGSESGALLLFNLSLEAGRLGSYKEQQSISYNSCILCCLNITLAGNLRLG